MEKAVIFNIQRYSLHDGGGIRTVVFFKGCPIRCPWCSNPESLIFNPQIMVKESICMNCKTNNPYKCDNDPLDCPMGAREIIGREYNVDEVVEEIKKDIVFYDTTGGGVTLSGGEVLSQGEFAIKLLKELKKININTAIETSGIGKFKVIDEMSDYLDIILWDFKIFDEHKSKEIINLDLDLMISNFEGLMKKGAKVIPRLPIIPGFTSSLENVESIINYIRKFDIKEVHILPFHQYGSSKYKSINMQYTLMDLAPLDNIQINEIKEFIEGYGIKAIVGGY